MILGGLDDEVYAGFYDAYRRHWADIIIFYMLFTYMGQNKGDIPEKEEVPLKENTSGTQKEA